MANDRHQAPSYPLRMPEELKQKIAESADANGRSLHAELLLRLGASFEKNQSDADLAKLRLNLAEAGVVETKLVHKVVHLGNCVMFLLQAIRGPNPKGALEAFSDLAEAAEVAATDALTYEAQLNPQVRLDKYREEIEEARELLKVWRLDLVDFFSAEPFEDAGLEPLTLEQRRKLIDADAAKKRRGRKAVGSEAAGRVKTPRK